jgi:hypothetical protein
VAARVSSARTPKLRRLAASSARAPTDPGGQRCPSVRPSTTATGPQTTSDAPSPMPTTTPSAVTGTVVTMSVPSLVFDRTRCM